MELTVLGCSGSYNAPSSGPCSGYLVRSGAATLWLDCGNGTFEALQRHVTVDDLTAIVITHRHTDHCVDLIGLHTLLKWYRHETSGPPVYAPGEVLDTLSALQPDLGAFFPWDEVGDGDERRIGDLGLRFSRTDHPPPTVAVEVTGSSSRLVYTSDTGPGWSPSEFAERADLVLSEATYQQGDEGDPVHLTGTQAGDLARGASARRLVLTHLVPLLDPQVSVAQAEEAFGGPVMLAAPGLRVRI